MNIKKRKEGQVTIFIIIAVLVIALAVLIYIYFPKLTSSSESETRNPYSYMQECLEDKIAETVEIVAFNGGDYEVTKDFSFYYKGDYVKYLCYTNEYYSACVNQEPFLTEHVEYEILNEINPSIESCFDSMVESYENRGYEVILEEGVAEVSIIPDRILTELNYNLTLTKKQDVNIYKNFDIELESNLYDILEIVKNILVWEINVGDSLPEEYMYINPYMKIEKKRKENEVRFYILTDRNTEEVFRFAVRSFAIPVGYEL